MSERRFVRTIRDGQDVFQDVEEVPTDGTYYIYGPDQSRQLVVGNPRVDTLAIFSELGGSGGSSGGGAGIRWLIEELTASQTNISTESDIIFTCKMTVPSETSKVLFYLNSIFVGQDVSEPYQLVKQFSSTDNGPAQITAVAYDFSVPARTLSMSMNISIQIGGVIGGDINADPLTRNYLPNPDFFVYENPMLINDAWVAANRSTVQSDGKTIVINGRNFKSAGVENTNSGTLNAVHILVREYIVEFHNCIFAGYGSSGPGNGITGGTYSQRVRYYGCKFYGLIPPKRGYTRGRGLQFASPAEVVVKNCDFYNTMGILLGGWSGGGRNLPNTVDIRFNRFFNLDGRVADPDQLPLYPGGPSKFMIGNSWGGDTSIVGKLWGSTNNVGTSANFGATQSRLVTSFKIYGTHTGGEVQVQILLRGSIVTTLTFASGVSEVVYKPSEPLWLAENETLQAKISSKASGSVLKDMNYQLIGLPSVGISTVSAVGNTGQTRVKWNHELRANGSTPATRTEVVCDSHTGGEIKFNIIDRDVLLNTERILGTATLPADATRGTVSIALPECIRTGRLLKLVVTSLASGATCSNVRVGFYSSHVGSFAVANLLQMDDVQNIPNATISHNLVVNTPNQNRCEDLLSLYRTLGQPTNPVLMDNNLFLGGSEVYDPWFNPADTNQKMFGDNMPLDWPEREGPRGYASSGGQGLLGDGNGATDLTDPGFCLMRRMTVVGATNYSIGVAGGHDQTIEDCTVLRSGYVYGITRDVVFAWGHVGVQIQDYNTYSSRTNSIDWNSGIGKSVPLGRTNSSGQTTGPRWYNNKVRRIRGNYVRRDKNGVITSQSTTDDGIILVNAPLAENYGHTVLLDLSRAQEQVEIDTHITRWRVSGYLIGS